MDLHGLDAIIFDFDGVLVESVNVKTLAFCALYEDHGKSVIQQVERYHLRNGGMSRFDKFRYFQTEILGGPPLDEDAVEALAGLFSKLVIDQVVSAPMVPGARSFLDSCRHRMPLFVVSGTPTAELDEIIQRRNLSEYFVATRGSPASKAQNISELLLKHDLAADRCIMFGDAIADYEGATANAVHFIGRVAENDTNPFSSNIKTIKDFDHLPASWN